MQFIKFSNFDKKIVIVYTYKKYKLNLISILIFSKVFRPFNPWGLIRVKINIMYFET